MGRDGRSVGRDGMTLPTLDFETYSEAGQVWDAVACKWRGPAGAPKGQRGLGVVGAANYARHPTTEVLSASYDLGQGLRRWRPGAPPPFDLFAHVAAGGRLEAWNSAFEWWIWNEVCARRYGWPPLPLEQLRCAMAKSRAHALPGKLELVSDVLDLTHKKDPAGTRLLAKFSVPRNPTKSDPRRRILPADEPEEAERLYAYNDRDVVAEVEASARTPDLSPAELEVWLLDQRINRRGVQVDLPAVHDCCAIVEACVAKYDAELVALTGCKSTELQQLRGWLAAHSVYADSLDAENVEALLASATLPAQCRRALELRQAVGSASVKKVFAMRNLATSEGRLHDLYNYHGARTGRPTGADVQPTNLPKAGPDVYRCGWLGRVPLPGGGCGRRYGAHRYVCPWCGTVRGPQARKSSEWHPEAVDDALEVIAWRSLVLLELFFGEAMLTVAGCLRGLFIASPGNWLVSSDFTAIEGVVIACLAGEQWRIDVFRSGGAIYVESAARAFGVPVAEMLAHHKATGQHHPLRDKGKRMELGLGFGGWITALRSPQIRYEGTDDELKDAIIKWRDASPALVHFWGGQANWRNPEHYGLEGMAVLAVQNPGLTFPVHRLDGSYSGVSYYCADDVLYCTVPSGGHITYHRPRLAPAAQEWRGLSLTYEGYNTNPKQGPVGWVTMSLYSGKAAENVTQKVARDIQMHAIANAERGGYPVALHTYDEIAADVPEGTGSVEELEALMCNVPAWARGWPIKAAGGWAGRRYRKG